MIYSIFIIFVLIQICNLCKICLMANLVNLSYPNITHNRQNFKAANNLYHKFTIKWRFIIYYYLFRLFQIFSSKTKVLFRIYFLIYIYTYVFDIYILFLLIRTINSSTNINYVFSLGRKFPFFSSFMKNI